MDIMKLSEKVMSMDDESWGRHSNPWSVYTRFITLPLISLAFWSREWLDIYALIPIALSIFLGLDKPSTVQCTQKHK